MAITFNPSLPPIVQQIEKNWHSESKFDHHVVSRLRIVDLFLRIVFVACREALYAATKLSLTGVKWIVSKTTNLDLARLPNLREALGHLLQSIRHTAILVIDFPALMFDPSQTRTRCVDRRLVQVQQTAPTFGQRLLKFPWIDKAVAIAGLSTVVFVGYRLGRIHGELAGYLQGLTRTLAIHNMRDIFNFYTPNPPSAIEELPVDRVTAMIALAICSVATAAYRVWLGINPAPQQQQAPVPAQPPQQQQAPVPAQPQPADYLFPAPYHNTMVGKECNICLVAYEPADQGQLSRLRCTHLYHTPCITQWIITHPICPNCRTDLTAPQAAVQG